MTPEQYTYPRAYSEDFEEIVEWAATGEYPHNEEARLVVMEVKHLIGKLRPEDRSLLLLHVRGYYRDEYNYDRILRELRSRL